MEGKEKELKEKMKEIMIGLAFMAVYVPVIAAYIMKGDEMLEKIAVAIEAFLSPVKAEPKEHADLIAMFGEAVDA